MEIEFDPVKDQLNVEKHSISLASAMEFDWDAAQIEEDMRFLYSETRYEATGWLGERLYVVIFCKRGNATRVISMRKANEREARDYANSN